MSLSLPSSTEEKVARLQHALWHYTMIWGSEFVRPRPSLELKEALAAFTPEDFRVLLPDVVRNIELIRQVVICPLDQPDPASREDVEGWCVAISDSLRAAEEVALNARLANRLGEPAAIPDVSSVTWQSVAADLNRRRLQNERFPTQEELARQYGCSKGLVHKAIHSDPELVAWAKPTEAMPRAVGQSRKVESGDKRSGPASHEPVSRELDPAAAAAAKEWQGVLKNDAAERAFFLDEMRDASDQFKSRYMELTSGTRKAWREYWGHFVASRNDAKTWFFALGPQDQVTFFDDPDRGQKSLPRTGSRKPS
jgi:hypothetical protein